VQPPERRIQIPGYRDFVEIGRGGFAIVYRAQQDVFQRAVAVKVITVLDVDEAARRRFQRECTAIGRLAWHPHIVTQGMSAEVLHT
jgi:serine/threonine-protein kinase PknK